MLNNKGRARIFEVTVVAAVTVRDQTENKVLYDNKYLSFEVNMNSRDPRSFFNEEDPAVLPDGEKLRRKYRLDPN